MRGFGAARRGVWLLGVGPVHLEPQHGDVGESPTRVGEQVPNHGSGQVCVVDRDDRGIPPADRTQDLAEDPGGLRGVRSIDQAAERGDNQVGPLAGSDQPARLPFKFVDGRVRAEPERRGEEVLHRSDHRALALPGAPARDGSRSPEGAPDELLDQPRLADARRTEDRYGVRRPGPGDSVQRPVECLDFSVSSDECDVRHAGRLLSCSDAHQAERRHRLALALELERFDRLDLRDPAGEVEGLGSEIDRAREGSLLQPRRDVHGVAGDERRACRWITGYDLTGVDADPQLELRAVPLAEFGVHARHHIEQPPRRVDAADGVVLVDPGDAEYSHHSVADELLDGAAVALEALTGRGVESA